MSAATARNLRNTVLTNATRLLIDAWFLALGAGSGGLIAEAASTSLSWVVHRGGGASFLLVLFAGGAELIALGLFRHRAGSFSTSVLLPRGRATN